MKAWLYSVSVLALVSMATAHPGHERSSYGIFWKNANPNNKTGQVAVSAKDIWRYAFVSRYQWSGSSCSQW